MPIMRDEAGIVYTSIDKMNSLIQPNEMGIFELSATAKQCAAKPLDAESAKKIYQYIPKNNDEYLKQKGLMPTVAITYWSGSSEAVHERVKRSLVPHTNSPNNNEAHFLFAGAMILYLDAGHGQFAVVLQPGDWIYIDGRSDAWPKLTDEKYFTLASYHSSPLAPVDEFHKQVKYTNTQVKPIL